MKCTGLIALLFVVGCAHPSRTSSFQIKDAATDKAIIYLYRMPTHVHSLNPDIPKFYAGDRTIGKLVIGGYYAIEVDPGAIDITYKTPLFGIYFPWKSGRLTVKAESEKPVFIKFEVSYGMGSITTFKQVPEKTGFAEITKTSLLKN